MANLNYNHVTIAGRLTADPELKSTASGLFVTTFQIAYNRPKRVDDSRQADFFTATAWRETAKTICQYFHKGSSILIDGELQTRSWQGNGGKKNEVTEILVNRAYFVDSRAKETSPTVQTPYTDDCNSTTAPYERVGYPRNYANMTEIDENDDLPF